MMGKYFAGMYFKHQANGKSLALIPGRAMDGAFIQIITEEQAYHVPYVLTAYQKRKDGLSVGGNLFTHSGVKIDIETKELTLKGEVPYGKLTPIRGDIMGPFRFVPMECRHGIVSMNHSLQGSLCLNGEIYNFDGGRGYIEADSGQSFPRAYTWVQSNDFTQNCSIMAAVAEIPFLGFTFWGVICVVHLDGREYRLATYNGAKILRCEPGALELRCGKYQLSITTSAGSGHELYAPHMGEMRYFIRENLSCPVRFRFAVGGQILLEEESTCASYECELDTTGNVNNAQKR